VEVFVVTDNGDGTLTKTGSQTVNVPAGANNNVPVFIPIAMGQYVGFHSNIAVHFTNPGSKQYFYANAPFSVSTSYITSFNVTVEFGAVVQGEYLAKINHGSNAAAPALTGKKWAALGTSITVQGFYTGPLVSLTGMTLTNLGFSGGSLGIDPQPVPHYGSGQITNRIASIPLDTDVVTIELPINDFSAAQVPLGVLGDTTPATFYGALWNAAIAIDTRVDNAKQVWIMGYGGGPTGPNLTTVNRNGNRLFEFQRAIQDVAQVFAIPVCDVGRNAGVGFLDANTDIPDGVHIFLEGGVKVANYMNWFFNQLVEQRYIV
jgi:hypothetical protein